MVELLRFESVTLAYLTKLENDFLAVSLHTRDEDVNSPYSLCHHYVAKEACIASKAWLPSSCEVYG